LGDPISALDFSGHKWLGEQREEAWSNWLAWLLSTMQPSDMQPSKIWTAFGVSDEDARERVKVRREETVPEGHPGHEGRLDIVVRFGDVALLVIEVKLVEAEEADSAKQRGYSLWVADQLQPHKHKVMLVRDAAEQDCGGFPPLRWDDLCIALRSIAVRHIRDKRTLMAAVILAFVGAVEQNLLGLRRQLPFSNVRLAEHLEKFLKECPHA
jgi:hypothetical protein